MFVRRLLITNAIQLSPKNISSVIARSRFGSETDLVANGTLTSMNEYFCLAGNYISYQLCLQRINFSLYLGLLGLICLFVWFPASQCWKRLRCIFCGDRGFSAAR